MFNEKKIILNDKNTIINKSLTFGLKFIFISSRKPSKNKKILIVKYSMNNVWNKKLYEIKKILNAYLDYLWDQEALTRIEVIDNNNIWVTGAEGIIFLQIFFH